MPARAYKRLAFDQYRVERMTVQYRAMHDQGKELAGCYEVIAVYNEDIHRLD